MSEQRRLSRFQEPTIQLEFTEQEGKEEDIATTEELSRVVVSELRNNGYTVLPNGDAGIKGNPIFDIIIHGYRLIHDNEELLAALFSSVSGILALMRTKTPSASSIEITFTTTDYDKPVTIKAPDVETTMKLLDQFRDQHSEEMKKIAAPKGAKLRLRSSRKHHRQR